MKKYLVLFLLMAALVACDAPADDESNLPTLVPTIVVQDSDNQAAPVDGDEQSDSAPDAEESSVEDEEAGDPTTEEASTVNLDDSLIYNEPLDMDYRTTLEFYMTIEEERVGYVFADGSRTISPNASTMTFNMEGGAGGGLGETMNVTQIEDAFYYVAPPNDCISLAGQSGFENPFALFLDAGGFLTEEAERVLPDETINGVDSYHYELNQENLLSWSVYDIYDADLYIAKEGGYVVRLLITGFGVNEVVSGDAVQEGDIYYELNNIPEAVPAITIPAACEAATAITSDYPILDDATAVSSGQGFFSYETQTPFDDVITFYKESLTANNEWTLAQELIQEPNATITFTGAGGTLLVGLGPGQNGGVQVGIIATP